MTTALTNSVNTVWAQVGEDLGTDTMYEYMDRFGFNAEPPLDYPSFQLAASGEFADGKLLGAGSDQIDVGRMAIGQDKLNVTPLQMAMVAAAVANERRADGAAPVVEGDRHRRARGGARPRAPEPGDERGDRRRR